MSTPSHPDDSLLPYLELAQGDLANTFTFDEIGSSNLFSLIHLEHSYLLLLDFIPDYRNPLRWGHFRVSFTALVTPRG
jgi:hypothetical protein